MAPTCVPAVQSDLLSAEGSLAALMPGGAAGGEGAGGSHALKHQEPVMLWPRLRKWLAIAERLWGTEALTQWLGTSGLAEEVSRWPVGGGGSTAYYSVCTCLQCSAGDSALWEGADEGLQRCGASCPHADFVCVLPSSY